MAIAMAIFLVIFLLTGSSIAQVAVKVGDLGVNSDAAFYLGLERGYYRERGIDPKLERSASVPQMMAPLSTAETQVAGGCISPGLFNAIVRGLPVKIVAPRARAVPGFDNTALLVRTDLAEKFRRPADLKGLKIAINARGSPFEYVLRKAMEAEGLSLKDVEVVYMPFSDTGPTMVTRPLMAAWRWNLRAFLVTDSAPRRLITAQREFTVLG